MGIFDNQARDTYFDYMKKFLAQRPEISYSQAQSYTLAVDKFYTDLYNAKGKLESTDENQYNTLLEMINSRVTENPAPIVPVGLNPPSGGVLDSITLPDFNDMQKKVEGYLMIAAGVIGSGLLFYVYIMLKKR